MPFSEGVKRDAKRKAHYTCVLCRQRIFLEVHHIEPEEEGGSSNIDNAAPLCPTCHDLYGSNPEKRKFVREVRDFWWEHCAKIEQHPSLIATNERLDQLQQQLQAVAQNQERQVEIVMEMKALYADQLKSTAGWVSSATTAKELMIASGSAFLTPGAGSVVITGYEPIVSVTRDCSECGFRYDMERYPQCPKCGSWVGGPRRSA